MTDAAPASVLKRKTEAGRSLPGPGAMTPARALGHALAKVAQDLLDLPLHVTGLKETRLSLAEIPEKCEERSLLAVLSGPKEGLGLMALPPATLAVLIEMQTIGKMSAGPVTPRRPTRTDAAMSMRFINQVLSELELLLSMDRAAVWAGGFRYSSYLDNPRPLGLLLEDAAYRAFQIQMDVGPEPARQCTLFLAFPADGRGTVPIRIANAPAATPPGPALASWSELIETAVMGSRVHLAAVFDTVSMPLSEVLELKPGAILPLPANSLGHIRIEGRGHRLVTHGKLGQCQGKFAVRVMMNDGADAQEEDEQPAAAGFLQGPPAPQADIEMAEYASMEAEGTAMDFAAAPTPGF